MKEKESSRRLPSTLRRLAHHQDQVITREQLATLGIGHSGVASRSAQGVWRELGPRVVVLHSGTLTRSQARWVGGLRRFEERDVQVAIEHGRAVGDSWIPC